MKNILLLAHDDPGQEARFQAAVDLTRALDGHLTCLDVAVQPALVGGGYDGGMATAMLLQDEVERESANRTHLEFRLQHEDVPWNWLETSGAIAPCLQEASGLADLIVVNRQLDDFPVLDMRTAAGDLVVKSGKPLLAVPPELDRLDLDRALVAWDGSIRSAAALRAAVPLLALAQAVVLFEVDDGSVETRAEDALAYLSRYGITARIERMPRGDATTAALIVHQAVEAKAGYIVMGGFGHLRFVEALFGGVTRALLSRSPLPLFLAH